MGKIVFALLCVLVFTIPFENLIVFGEFGTFSRVLGIAAAGLGILTVLGRGRIRPLKPIHYLIGLFVFWAFLSLAWTADLGAGAVKLTTYVQLAGMTWLIWEFAASPSRQMALIHAYVLGGCASLPMQWYVMSHAPRIARGVAARFAGGRMDVNAFALCLVISIVFAAFYATDRQAKSKVLRIAWLCYCPLAALGVAFTGSRMGLVILVFSGVLIVALRITRPVFFAVLAVVAVGIVASLPKWLPESTFERLAGTGEAIRTGDWSNRLEILEAGLKVLERHPIIGVGVGAFGFVVDPELPHGITHHASAHNTYLNTAVELGAVGAMLFLAILASAGYYAIRAPGGQRLLWIVTLATSGLAAVALHTDTHKLLWYVVALLSSQCVALANQRVRAQPRRVTVLMRPPRYLPAARWSSGLSK